MVTLLRFRRSAMHMFKQLAIRSVKFRWVFFFSMPGWFVYQLFDDVFGARLPVTQIEKYIVVSCMCLTLSLPLFVTAIATQFLIALGELKTSVWVSYFDIADQLNISNGWNTVYYGGLFLLWVVHLLIVEI